MTKLEAYTYLGDKVDERLFKDMEFTHQFRSNVFEAFYKIRNMTGKITEEWIDGIIK